MSLVFPRLYAIIDAALLSGTALAVAEELAWGGVGIIQYRDKSTSARSLLSISRSLASFLAARGVRFIVNDRPDVAVLAGADGVHVGQADMPVGDARRILGAGRWIGVSTHSEEQVRQAGGTSADYVAVGPVFPTGTKEDAEPAVGLHLVQAARQVTQKPVVAIGGITVETAGEVYRAGADCVAVARDLLCSGRPRARALEFLAMAREVFGES
jgi:thiamine-phosphate pyrophosphorylase